MSYILEALRRSQAERERGRVPGLDAQLAASAEKSGPPRAAVPWVWLAAGLGAGLLAAVAVWALRAGFGGRPAQPPAPEVAAAPVPGPAPAVAVAAAPVPVPAPAPAPATVAPLPIVVSAPPPPAPAPAPVAVPATPAPRAAVPPPAAQAEPRATPLAELSPDQRRDMPHMAIGGAIWSENAASRFIMVNGQVVHEGDPAAPGVTVERIGQKAAVLRWRDLRIEVPF